MGRNNVSKDARIVKTVCSMCYCGCGVLAHVKDGKLVRIVGDKEHPNNRGELCIKGLSGIELLYHPNRINYPMERAGRRGEGKWKRLSWEDAISKIADRLSQIIDKDGVKAVCVANGSGLYGNSGMLGQFVYYLGTPNMMSSAFICFMPTALAARATIGYPAAICAEELVFDEVVNSNCVLLWGANPKNSCPFPVGKGILSRKEQGAKLIVVDPRPTEFAKIADYWLKIRPATDDALALGMINVIINESIYDKAFVDRWTFGFDELKSHVQKYTPELVSEITWVPKKDIVGAARLFAEAKPGCVCQRVPLDQNTNAVQSSRAIFILNSLCGNLDRKGGNLLPIKGDVINEIELWTKPDELPKEILELRIGAKEIPLMSGPDAFCGIVHPKLWADSIVTGKPYRLKALITTGRNQMLGDQDTSTVMECLKRIDFSVTMDLFMTPTAALSDIVLPAASWLERDGFRGHPGHPYCIPIQHKVIEPLYERWDDNTFYIELAKKMGLKIPWDSIEEYHDFRLKGRGMAFKDLEGVNFLSMTKKYDRIDKGQFKFNTQSEKVELYSTFLERYGFDPLPNYIAPPETTHEFPYILMGGKKKLEYVHSAGRQIEMLRAREKEPTIEIGPKTAKQIGISSGDWVWVETIDFGSEKRVKFKAKILEGILEGLVAVEHGWWFPESKGPEYGCLDSNINMVITGGNYDPIYGSTNIRSVPCRIYRM